MVNVNRPGLPKAYWVKPGSVLGCSMTRRLSEWRDDPDGETPFAVARLDGDPVVFAGIWENWHSPEGDVLHTFSTHHRR